MHFSALELETSLFTHMNKTVVAGVALQKAQAELSFLTGKRDKAFYWCEAVRNSLKTWLAPHCKKITEEAAGGTGIKLTVDSLPNELSEVQISNYDFDNCKTIDEINDVIKLKFENASYSFTALATLLEETTETLHSQGKTNIADNIADELGFIHYDNQRSREFFKETKRHIQFDRTLSRPDYGRYDYRVREKFFNIAKELSFIEEETGTIGLSKPFKMLSEMLEIGGDISGFTIGNIDGVQIKVFNKHLRVSMTPTVMDGLMCFLYLYKSERVILKAINHDQQQQLVA